MLHVHRVMRVGLPGLAWMVTAALAVLAAGCSRHSAPPPPEMPPVTICRPIEHDVVEWDEYIGHLEALESVDVRARVSGFIVSEPFKEGAMVHQGDVLFEIDARPFQADLDAKKADQVKAEAQVYLAEVEYKRTKGLLTKQAAPPIEFQTADANLRQAQAVLAGAKAAVESARLNVEWCRVVAPVAGRVSRQYVNAGNLISGGAGQATLLTTIQSIDPIYCYFDVFEQAVLKYQKLAREKKRPSARLNPTPCYMELENETGFPHKGVIDFIDNRLDPGTGTMHVRGVFPNPEGYLTPGFLAKVRVPGSGRYRALLVPELAVAVNQDQKLLFIVGPDDVAKSRQVKLGALFGRLRAVLEGVGPQDRIIVEGQMRVRTGVKVNPREVPVDIQSAQLTAFSPVATQTAPTTRPAVALGSMAPAPPASRAAP